MKWQQRSPSYDVATVEYEHNGRTFAVNVYRDSYGIALHGFPRPSGAWAATDRRIAHVEVRVKIAPDTSDAEIERVCTLVAGMCATLAREAER